MSRQPGYELDRIIFRVKKDAKFRSNFLSHFDLACREFKLTEEEERGLKLRDYISLAKLGLKPELIMALAEIDKEKP